jgi:endonuclease/exonuclease/phosphatase family metal-dependent hydrolase
MNCAVVTRRFPVRMVKQKRIDNIASALIKVRHSQTISANQSFSSHDSIRRWQNPAKGMVPIAEFSVVSFNMLAACYKRLSLRDVFTKRRIRESRIRNIWLNRAENSLEFMRKHIYNHDDIVALQEFWLDDGFSLMMQRDFATHGYDVFVLPRSDQKLDAIAFLIRRSQFEALGSEVVPLMSRGENDAPRVALLMWLRHRLTGKDVAVANTHLSFPHTSADTIKQEKQIKALTKALHDFVLKNDIYGCAQMVMGDLNVDINSSVCTHLHNQGYSSSFEIAPPELSDAIMDSYASGLSSAEEKPIANFPTTALPSPVMSGRGLHFISHRNHHMEEIGADHIFIAPERYSSQRTELFVSDSSVLPVNLPFHAWDESYTISDHRPVRSRLVFAKPIEAEELVL